MLEKIEGIIIDIVRHTDKHNVVTLYTRQRGRMAFLIPLGVSKSGRLRNAAIQPMAVVGADVNIRSGKELHTLRQVNPLRLWHGIYSNPVKSSIIFFLTEFCNRLLRQYPADEKLWNFLMQSLSLLDTLSTRQTANFHIAFLIRLLPMTGIEPSVERWEPGLEFDMLSGEMADRNHPSFLRRRSLLSEDESSHIPMLMRMNFDNMHLFRFSHNERNRLLDRLLAYYGTHLPLGSEFKSLSVLRELYS